VALCQAVCFNVNYITNFEYSNVNIPRIPAIFPLTLIIRAIKDYFPGPMTVNKINKHRQVW